MNKERPVSEPPRSNFRFPLVFATASLISFLAMSVSVRFFAEETNLWPLLFVFFAFLLAINLLAWSRDGVEIQDRKESRREHRRHLARVKEAANLNAQLQKPDFETRLSSFTQAEGSDELLDAPESQMGYWERSSEYERTPARPIEIIRYLLQRISKLVGQR